MLGIIESFSVKNVISTKNVDSDLPAPVCAG